MLAIACTIMGQAGDSVRVACRAHERNGAHCYRLDAYCLWEIDVLGLTHHLTTLVFAFDADQVLLLRRRKAPNLGLWSPPGGKIEPGESPLRCAVREFEEETGLEPRDPALRVVVSELDKRGGDAWLMFCFEVAAQGTPAVGQREGDARWIPLDAVVDLPRPPADGAILDAVIRRGAGVSYMEITVHPDGPPHVRELEEGRAIQRQTGG